MGFSRFLKFYALEFTLHSLQTINLLLNRTNRVKVLIEFLLVSVAQLPLERTCILQDQIGYIAVGLQFARAKQAPIGLARVPQGGRYMTGAIPRDVIKVNGLLVVLMAVTAKFQRAERRVLTQLVSENVVKRARLRIRLLGHGKGTGTG